MHSVQHGTSSASAYSAGTTNVAAMKISVSV